MSITAKLRDHDRLSRRDLHQTRVRRPHLEPKTFSAVDGARRQRAVGTERHPIAVIFPRIIILEPVPFRFRFVEPVHVPDPLQVVRSLRAHEIHDVAVGVDVTLRTALRAAVPFPIPGKPISIRLRAPFDQNRRAESLRVARPRFQIVVKFSGENVREAESFLDVPLLQIGAQHEPDIRNLAKPADPIAGGCGKLSRFRPVARKENPGCLCSQGLFKTRHVSRRDIMFGRIVPGRWLIEIKTLI